MTLLYERLIKPVLFRFDPQLMHDVFTLFGRILGRLPPARWVLRVLYRYSNPVLRQELLGLTFENPVGLAAGFDKEALLTNVMYDVGFGFEEVGSITAQPYKGNPGKHMVRLPRDESMIIFYGLKSSGAKNLKRHLRRLRPRFPIGVSVAKTNTRFDTLDEKLADWVEGVRQLRAAGDYVTINVSCPNTYDTQNFNDPELLGHLLRAVEEARVVPRCPVFLKISPDNSAQQVERILSVCARHDWVKGFIVSNLIKDRSRVSLKTPKRQYQDHPGGLSGRPLRAGALSLLRLVRERAGDRYVLIGCGGIFTAEDAYAYIKAGASLVQLVTGMIFKGPGAMAAINKGLVRLLRQDGFSTIAEAVGSETRVRKEKKITMS